MSVQLIEIVIPDDASSLGEACGALIGKHRCGNPAAWRVLVACPGCSISNVWVLCTRCTRRTREVIPNRVSSCCKQYIRIVGVEPL